jgi:hypothetical protein
MKKSAGKTKDGLNLKHEKFCKLFVESDKNFYGNGVNCYIEVYKPKQVGNWYNVAKASASRLLTNVNVCKRINELLEIGGFNNENVDKQHLFLINQHADLKTKLGAIHEYNTLKKRVESKIEINIPAPIYGGSSTKK